MAPFGDRTSCEELGTLIGIIPDWCCSSWCFVDVKNCKRPHSSLYSHSFHEYTDFAFVDSIEEGKEHYLSYETCGNIDVYTPDQIYEALRTYDLRISFPGDSSDGYTLTTVSDTKRGGSNYDFMERISLKYNITWIEKAITEKSYSKHSSSYTSCVHDISLGKLRSLRVHFLFNYYLALFH